MAKTFAIVRVWAVTLGRGVNKTPKIRIQCGRAFRPLSPACLLGKWLPSQKGRSRRSCASGPPRPSWLASLQEKSKSIYWHRAYFTWRDYHVSEINHVSLVITAHFGEQ